MYKYFRYIFVYMYSCKYAYINVYTYIYIHIHIYIYTSRHDLIQYYLNMHTDKDIAQESTPDSDTLEEAVQVFFRGQGVCFKV